MSAAPVAPEPMRPRPLPRAEPVGIAGRVPPNDLDVEGALLGAVLTDPTLLAKCVDLVTVDFYSAANRAIWDTVRELERVGDAVGFMAVGARLRQKGLLAEVGGSAYLGSLMNDMPTGDVAKLARTLRDLGARRRLLAVSHRVQVEGYGDVGPDQAAWMADAVSELQAIAASTERAVASLFPHGEDVIFERVEDVPWICQRFGIAPGPPSMLAGFGYSRKTLAAQSLLLSVASGRHLFGKFPVRRGMVRHLDYEQGRRLTRSRYQRLALGMGITNPKEELAGQIRFGSFPRLTLTDRSAELQLSRELQGVALLVIDSLKAACPGLDENKADVRGPLDMLARVSEDTGCTIVIIHHARKEQPNQRGGALQTVRGSGALIDGCQSVVVFEGIKGQPTTIKHEKARVDGQTAPDYALDSVDLDWNGEVWLPTSPERLACGLGGECVALECTEADQAHDRTADSAIDAMGERILAFLRVHPGASTAELKAGVSGDTGVKAAALGRLERDGCVRNGGGRGGRGGSKAWFPTVAGGVVP